MQPHSAFASYKSVKAQKIHCCMQLAYNESAETNLGPFNVEARLTSVGGAVLYATGSGKVIDSSVAWTCVMKYVQHLATR